MSLGVPAIWAIASAEARSAAAPAHPGRSAVAIAGRRSATTGSPVATARAAAARSPRATARAPATNGRSWPIDAAGTVTSPTVGLSTATSARVSATASPSPAAAVPAARTAPVSSTARIDALRPVPVRARSHAITSSASSACMLAASVVGRSIGIATRASSGAGTTARPRPSSDDRNSSVTAPAASSRSASARTSRTTTRPARALPGAAITHSATAATSTLVSRIPKLYAAAAARAHRRRRKSTGCSSPWSQVRLRCSGA